MTTFSISATAREAGVSRTTLQRAIKSWRLSMNYEQLISPI